jgi:UTP--glucose-1-phosphate uridylyltransferase
MIEVYDRYQSSILGVQEVEREDVSKYGIVDGVKLEERVFRVKGLVEKPDVEKAPSRIAILGRYIISPAIFEILAHTRPGKGDEIQLTDALQELAQKEESYAYIFEGRRYDVGDRQGFLEATVEYALRREDLREEFLNYLVKVTEKEIKGQAYDEAAVTEEK